MEHVEPPKPPAQAFFQQLATEMRRPSYGDQARAFAQAMLIRAQEAGLYTPEPQ